MKEKSLIELRKERDSLKERASIMYEKRKLEREIKMFRRPGLYNLKASARSSGASLGRGIVKGSKGFLKFAEATSKANQDLMTPNLKKSPAKPNKKRRGR